MFFFSFFSFFLWRAVGDLVVLPVHGPSVLVQELVASLLESQVGPQVGRVERVSGQGVDALPSEVLHDGGALV